jgi:hypothetical protein
MIALFALPFMGAAIPLDDEFLGLINFSIRPTHNIIMISVLLLYIL